MAKITIFVSYREIFLAAVLTWYAKYVIIKATQQTYRMNVIIPVSVTLVLKDSIITIWKIRIAA